LAIFPIATGRYAATALVQAGWYRAEDGGANGGRCRDDPDRQRIDRAASARSSSLGLSPLDIGRMSLAEFLLVGRAYARTVDPAGAPAAASPTDDAFDVMLAMARETGFLAG